MGHPEVFDFDLIKKTHQWMPDKGQYSSNQNINEYVRKIPYEVSTQQKSDDTTNQFKIYFHAIGHFYKNRELMRI